MSDLILGLGLAGTVAVVAVIVFFIWEKSGKRVI